jgi:hypothetical protein
MKSVTYTTTMSGAKALVDAIAAYKEAGSHFEVRALQDLI